MPPAIFNEIVQVERFTMPYSPNNRRDLTRRTILSSAVIAIVLSIVFISGLSAGEMIEVELSERSIEGEPIAWDSEAVHLLGRDGRLWEFAPEEVIGFKKTASRFRAYSPSEFRSSLLRELGKGYEVSGTGHYLVAHPRGQRDRWAERFERLYRSFVQFFSVRGFRIEQPMFPLVGIVCKDRKDFRRSAAGDNNRSAGIEGYYNLDSNRITAYDMGGSGNSPGWHRNASVLIHEATHQVAFNTGVHNRFSPPPTWLAEGLAMLFEAPGVYDSHDYPNMSDRVNRDRLRLFRQYVLPRHKPEMIRLMVATDELFRINPTAAYAESWAFTFFISETMPRKYARYLKLTASRPPFSDYSPAERTADFTSVFGGDWRMLEARFLRFIADVE